MNRSQVINKILEAREILAEVLDASIGEVDISRETITEILNADTALQNAHSCSCETQG